MFLHATQVELTCSVCKVFKCNMTAKGVEAKTHLEKCKGSSILECFGKEAADFYGGGGDAGDVAAKGPKGPKPAKEAVPTNTCKYAKCKFAPASSPGSPEIAGYCCGKCYKSALARITPAHGPYCEQKPEEF